jgi:hypothetical protein
MLDPDLNPLAIRGNGGHPAGAGDFRSAFNDDFPGNGAVRFDAGTQTPLFFPTAICDAPASLTSTVSNGRSAPASANVLLTVNALAPGARNDSGFVPITRPTPTHRRRSLQAAVGFLGDNPHA